MAGVDQRLHPNRAVCRCGPLLLLMVEWGLEDGSGVWVQPAECCQVESPAKHAIIMPFCPSGPRRLLLLLCIVLEGQQAAAAAGVIPFAALTSTLAAAARQPERGGGWRWNQPWPTGHTAACS